MLHVEVFRHLAFLTCITCNCCAAIESIDIPRILSQQGGEAVYPLPRIKSLEVHPKLNLAALLFVVKYNYFHNLHMKIQSN